MPTLDIFLRRLDGSYKRIRSSPDTTFRDSLLTRQDYYFTKPDSVIRVGKPVDVDSWEGVLNYQAKPDIKVRKSIVVVDEGSTHAISYGDAPKRGWLLKAAVDSLLTSTDNVMRSSTATLEDKLDAFHNRGNAESNVVNRESRHAVRKTMRHIRMERAKSKAGKHDLESPVLKLGFVVIVACVVLAVVIFGAIVGAAFLESRQAGQPLINPGAGPAASLLLLPLLGIAVPMVRWKPFERSHRERKEKISRETLFLFTETYIYELMVPVALLDQHLDYRARSRPTTAMSRMIGAGLGTLLLGLVLYGGVLASFGSTAIVGGAVLAIIFGLPFGGGIGALIGPHTVLSPKPFWVAERRLVASGDSIASWIEDRQNASAPMIDSREIHSRVYGDNLDEFDIRTPKGLKDASEGREAFFLFSAGSTNWQKIQLGGVIILLISVIFLMFLMVTVIAE